MKLYHASRVKDLNVHGIKPNQTPNVCGRAIPSVYMGTLNFIFGKYFEYAPSGTYFIYEIEPIENTTIPIIDLGNGEYRCDQEIPAKSVKIHDIYQHTDIYQ